MRTTLAPLPPDPSRIQKEKSADPVFRGLDPKDVALAADIAYQVADARDSGGSTIEALQVILSECPNAPKGATACPYVSRGGVCPRFFDAMSTLPKDKLTRRERIERMFGMTHEEARAIRKACGDDVYTCLGSKHWPDHPSRG